MSNSVRLPTSKQKDIIKAHAWDAAVELSTLSHADMNDEVSVSHAINCYERAREAMERLRKALGKYAF